MALFNGFTFDGVNSLDYGIYITGEGVYNAPERAVEMVEIQGRNGALAIDQGRWDNIEVTYHCGCFGADQEDFAERIGRFRNAICSRTSYCRLTDDYHPDEYRLALYHAGVEVDHVRRAGEFDLIFDCKPQRFLTSGEDTITVGDWGDVTEYSGDVVSFEGDEMTAVKSLSISLSPVQNLNGYDHPWVGGAGKNLFKPVQRTVSSDGVTYSVDADGKVTLTGTATATTSFTLITGASGATAPETGYYTASLHGATNAKLNGGGNTHTANIAAGAAPSVFVINVTSGTAYNESFHVQFEKGTTATAYEPYENICPISGWDGVSVTRAGDNLLPLDTGYPNKYLNGTGELSNLNGTWTSDFIAVKATPYTAKSSEADLVVCTYDANKAFIARYYRGTNFNRSMSFTPQTGNMENVRYIRLCHISATTPGAGIQLNFGATATAYEPYQGETITQEFVDSQGNTLTVYGGESEVVGGVLTVTHLLFTENGQAGWGRNNNGNFYKYYSPMPISVQDAEGCACNYAPYAINFNGWNVFARANGLISLGTSWGDIFPDVASLQAQFAQTPLQVVYKLATPITYTLTPQQVETLIGTNNVWSDAGEVTVEIADDPNKIVNPTLYDARPLIKVSGYGTVQVGSVTITIEGSASDVTYIDCDSMECYRLNGLAIVSANSAVSFSSYDFPVLEADAITGITYSTNISQVQIVPRWWQL